MEDKKLLIIVDMQNDFVTGSLANKEAQAIVKPICDFIKHWPGDIEVTRDTHQSNYLDTNEGKHLPVPHCLENTGGWCVVDDIVKTLNSLKKEYFYIDKTTFGTDYWGEPEYNDYNEFVLVGTCTDICVIANAMMIKTLYPEVTVKVISSLCAGVTPYKHECALEVMRSCQIEVEEEYSGELNS